MYLKSIELSGFKSFADHTKLVFEPGVTAVVGPNGSGKSNISDAVRWVLGEVSAKNLRGGRMEDVIFAGTQARKPVNFAEVILTIDNSDKALPLEFSEVCVARRVYRSGESEYYINKAQCRLKDVHELFMDTGLGRDGYSIIGQGRIDDIILGKSEERRGVFEEAAGISKYRHRKDEAERKLARTQDNLVRIGDIAEELSAQLEPLEAQSEKARKYLNLREALKVLEINVALRMMDKNKKDTEGIAERFSLVTSELEALQKSEAAHEAEAERLGVLAEAYEAEIEQTREAAAAAEAGAAGFMREIEVLKAGIASNQQMAQRLESDAKILDEKCLALDEISRELSQQLQDKCTDREREGMEAARLEERNKALLESISKGNERLDTLKADVIEKLNDIAASKAKTASLETFKLNFTQRREALQTQLAGIKSEVTRIDELRGEYRKTLSAKKNEMASSLAGRTALAEKQQNASAQADNAAHKLSQAELALHKDNSRLHMLREMERDFEGFFGSVKSVLAAANAGRLSGIHGPLSALLDVGGQYVVALEVALGSALQHVVVDSEAEAKAAIEFLKRQSQGRVTFLPISSVKGRLLEGAAEVKAQKGYIGIASEVIGYDKKYDGIVKNLLGRTVLVDNMENAIAMSRKFSYKFRVVTLEGEILNAGGAITGGSVSRASGLLSRADELKKLEKQIGTRTKDIEALRTEAHAAAERQESLQAELAQAAEAIAALEREQVRLQADCEHAQQLLDAAKRSQQAIDDELVQIEKQVHDTNEQIAQMINRTTKDEFEIEAAQAEAAGYEADFSALSQQREALGAQITDQSIKLNSIEKDIAAVALRMDDIGAQRCAASAEAAGKRTEIEALAAQNAETEKQIADKDTLVQDAQAQSVSLSSRLEQLTAQRGDAARQAREKAPMLKECRERIFALAEEQNRVENQRLKAEMELENIASRLWEDYEITYTTAQGYKKDIPSLPAASRRAGELRNQIKALGNVNVDAIEEYKSVRERFDFLTRQTADLSEAKDNLQKLIAQIQEKMKKQFKEQFSVISGHFAKVFCEMFGGGHAELRLTDPSDILESGVEIEVQPPGKKLQSMALLSGGEKAFTAIALLFAILKVRPAPFCVFDEIEAALDEPNVYRFADYLKKYSRGTQFIMVTHRRGTMEAAGLLYGVTMQERGVSKLLTLKLEEADSL